MQPEANWIDKLVSFVSPVFGARRARARYEEFAIRSFHGRQFYDAAKVSDSRNSHWTRSNASPNAVTQVTLDTLRARSRDVIRNDPYATNALRVLVTNIVGTGIIAQQLGPRNQELQDTQRVWRDWAEALECSADERNTYYGLQAMVVSEMVEAGEVLVRRKRLDSSSDREVPLEIEILEGDYLDPFRNQELSDGNFVVQGVEFDKRGKRVAYWLFDHHPGDTWIAGRQASGIMSKRVPADQILHVFQQWRAGQVRGLPWFSPSLVKLRDYSDFSDATLLRQKLAACVTAIVETPDGVEGLPVLQTGKETQKEDAEIRPGAWTKLPPGFEVKFPNAPSAASFAEVSPGMLRGSASGMGITYESMTGDYSEVNFSSARMAWLQFNRFIEQVRWLTVIPQFCSPTYRWWAEQAFIAGAVRKRPAMCRWTPPRREMIDPLKEGAAQTEAIRAGTMTLPEAIRENGYEPEEVLAEIAATNAILDKSEIILDSDPRKTQKSGTAQMLVEATANGA